MRIRDFLDRLLTLGGHAQLILALVGSTGLSGLVALAVAAVLKPETSWQVAFLVCVFAASLPVSFPLAAYTVNRALAWVDASRRRNLFDDPLEIARKQIDALMVDGRNLYASIPAVGATWNELNYHSQRFSHWHGQVDLELQRTCGYYAARWFGVWDDPEFWRPDRSRWDTELQLRAQLDSKIAKLQQIRGALPVDRKRWHAIATGIDIQSGRALLAYLESSDAEDHGIAEVATWANSVWAICRDESPEHMHLFSLEAFVGLYSVEARRSYVRARVADLENLWRSI